MIWKSILLMLTFYPPPLATGWTGFVRGRSFWSLSFDSKASRIALGQCYWCDYDLCLRLYYRYPYLLMVTYFVTDSIFDTVIWTLPISFYWKLALRFFFILPAACECCSLRSAGTMCSGIVCFLLSFLVRNSFRNENKWILCLIFPLRLIFS